MSELEPESRPTDLAVRPRPALPTVQGAQSIDLLELVLSGLKPSTAQGYREDLAVFAKHAGFISIEKAIAGLLQLGQVEANLILASWQHEMSVAGLAPATIRRRIAAVMRVFRRGRLVGLTNVHPEAELPRAECLRDTAGQGEEGFEKMLSVARGYRAEGEGKDLVTAIRNEAILLLLYDRALRRGELVELDFPRDFDLEKRAVCIRGKGRDHREWLTVSERATKAVSDWVMVRGDWPGPLFVRTDPAAIAGMPRVNGPTFGPLLDLPAPADPEPRPGRLTGESINRMVRAIGKAAKLKRASRAHGLRHAAITAALDRRRDYREVMDFSRHKDPKTIGIYDDNRKDFGGEIAREIAGEKRPPRKRR